MSAVTVRPSQMSELSRRVALAAGWTPCPLTDQHEHDLGSNEFVSCGMYFGGWYTEGEDGERKVTPPVEHWLRGSEIATRLDFDTDWSRTGPLIEHFGLTLVRLVGGAWLAMKHPGYSGQGETPLIAACEVVSIIRAVDRCAD